MIETPSSHNGVGRLIINMNLVKTSTSTALAIIPKETKVQPSTVAAQPEPTAPVKTDSVDVKGFDGAEVPADDDGPGAGGGYKPTQEPTEGPGAGGGYDAHEIPADDDGPGAGGGYDGDQEPAESDGPGAGGGYITNSGFGLSHRWSQPLAMYSPAALSTHDSFHYTPNWVKQMPTSSVSWSTANEAMMADPHGQKAISETSNSNAPQPAKTEEKK